MIELDQTRVLSSDQMIYVDDFLEDAIIEDLKSSSYPTIEQESAEAVRTIGFVAHVALDDALRSFIQHDVVRKLVSRWSDHAWRCVASGAVEDVEQYVSTYEAGNSHSWHTDHERDHRILTWYLPLDDPGAGGDLCFTRIFWDRRRDGKPPCARNEYKHFPMKLNRLLVMPAWVAHRLRAAKRRRTLAHGHFTA